MEISTYLPDKDPWLALEKFTSARIALGRTGVSIPLKENLQFKLAHAFARDAVFANLDFSFLEEGLKILNHPFIILHSKAIDRAEYLQRPDLGRNLDERSLSLLEDQAGESQYSKSTTPSFDLCITIADGLSATAINMHALPFLMNLFPLLIFAEISVASICLVEQGRVAISDETGAALNAKISIILIGERPGLSSPDSLGLYLTYHPKPGNTDAQRNCISNIGPNGLSYTAAAEKTFWLIKESLRLQLSGVGLKDLSGLLNR